MKRIALMVNDLCFGGAQRIIAELSVALEKKGYEVHLFLMNTKEIAYPYGGQLHKISFYFKQDSPVMPLISVQYLILTWYYRKKYSIDVCISAMDFLNLVNMLAPGKCRKIPTMHNYFLQHEMTPSHKDRFMEKWFSKVVKKADCIVAVSKSLRDKLSGLYKNYPSEKIFYIYNSSDIEQIKQMSAESAPDELLPYLGKNTFVNVARLTEQKSLDRLILAFSLLNKKFPDTRLIMIGDGHLGKKLKDFVRRLGLEHAVRFVSFTKNPFCIMSKCRAFAFSSHYEGFGNVIVEAMCCGLSIVSVDCLSGPAEILAPSLSQRATDVTFGEYGILIPAHDGEWIEEPDESAVCLAKGMEKLLTDDELNNTYKSKALNRAEYFSGDRIYDEWVDIIERGELQ